MNEPLHVLPIDDLKPHVDFCILMNDKSFFCQCGCGPEHKEIESGIFIIVHNSFDGREGVEWVNDLLDND